MTTTKRADHCTITPLLFAAIWMLLLMQMTRNLRYNQSFE